MDILIVGDQPVFSGRLKVLITSAYPNLVVNTCLSIHQAKRILTTKTCRLLLLELDLESYCALDQVASLSACPNIQSLCILSASENKHQIHESLMAGASGFIPKSYAPDKILTAIKSVLDGGAFVPKHTFGALMQNFREFKRDLCVEGLSELTNRQKQVVALVCKGLSNKQIARELGISEGTTKLHVSNIFSLVNVSKRSELIVKLVQSA